MAVTKIRRFSSWVLIVCTVITIAVLAIFYLGGVEDPAAENKAPIYTSLLLYWSYVLTALTIAGMLIFGILQFLSTLKAKPKAALGSLVVLIVFAALLGITFMTGGTEKLSNINVDSAHFNTDFWLKLSDMWLYSAYIMLILCIVAMIAGSIKSVFKK
ncbi:MAG: hypothetical protein LBJ23_06975 [Tannerella sp.]|jgi:hypothetical protein|nr:hypothetical protein [Tannerella sp.]